MNNIILTPSDSLVLVTSTTDTLHTTAHFADRSDAGNLVPDNALTVVNSSGNVVICPPPDTGKRVLKTISVQNTTNGSVTVHVGILRGSAVYRLYSATIAAGATFTP